jgi:hypothetical protein
MEQFTSYIDRANKYRYSHFQGFVSQYQKDSLVKNYISKSTVILSVPVLSSLLYLNAFNSGNMKLAGVFAISTFLSSGASYIANLESFNRLENELNKVNRQYPNPVQIQEEYARDLEIFQRIEKN